MNAVEQAVIEEFLIPAVKQIIAERDRYREALKFARETFRDNLSRYEYKNEPMMLQAYEQCNKALRGGEE